VFNVLRYYNLYRKITLPFCIIDTKNVLLIKMLNLVLVNAWTWCWNPKHHKDN